MSQIHLKSGSPKMNNSKTFPKKLSTNFLIDEILNTSSGVEQQKTEKRKDEVGNNAGKVIIETI